MASLTALSLAGGTSSLCGLKTTTESAPSSKLSSSHAAGAAPLTVRVGASMERPTTSSAAGGGMNAGGARVAALAAAAALMMAGTGLSPALAAKVEVGDEVGSFKFSPETVTVAAGEVIEFTLVGETGHNVVFDIPAGAPASVASELAAASMDENDLLSEDEATHKVKLSTPGTYTYYCTPHKSANMRGTVIVK